MGADDKYYFFSSGGWYYHDDNRNVYFEDGAIYCDGSFDFESDSLLEPSFYLDDVPYWFKLGDRLFFQGVNGSFYPVQVTRRHYFRSSKQLYYFDDFYTLYSEGGTLIYDVSSSELSVDRNFPDFYVGEEPYWIDLLGLWSRNADGTLYRVLKWQSDSSNPDELVGSPNDVVTSHPDRNLVLRRPKSKIEASLDVNSDFLQRSPKEGPRPLMWPPSSSSTTQPSLSISNIISSNDQPSEEPPLFQATEPGYFQAVIEGWLEDIAQLHAATESAQPGKKCRKEKRCYMRDKEFHRPHALAEHIRTHTGEKPEKRPFVGFTSAFATKLNMKRHFATHLVGELEDYQLQSNSTSPSSVTRQPTGKISRRAARNRTVPYNLNYSNHSNLHQTVRFRA